MAMCIFLFPEMEGELGGVGDMFSSMGSFTAAFGMDRLDFGTLEGFYAIECGNIMSLGGAFFAAVISVNIISKEEKDYPKVGNYEISFTYKKEKATVKVSVKDTTKPEIEAPESFDILQYTDLSQFNFSELFQVTDYSDVKDWKIDTSHFTG